MTTRTSRQHFEFETIHIDPQSPESQYRQLENQIRQAISARLLPTGSRVPSSRTLASLLGVSRNTVLAAYRQLISEGYLESETGSGTRVSELTPHAFEYAKSRRPPVNTLAPAQCLSAAGRKLADQFQAMPAATEAAQPFRPHLPDVDRFPMEIWNRYVNECSKWSRRQFQNSDPQGYRPLRQAIAQYMEVSRGVSCSADQVVVTAGAQQGLHLIRQLLLDEGDTIWVEEPGNMPASQLLDLTGIKVVGVPLDQEGLDPARLRRRSKPPKLIYVTPGGQWPMGMTMSLNRRLQLLTVARTHSSWILEDDYNGEYRYAGRPHPPLCGLDQTGRTIYMGTFSKLLFPGIRLAFLIVPRQLANTFAYARWLHDRFSPPLIQMVLHRFIESGQFLKHVRQMRSLYRERQAFLYESLRGVFGENIRVELPESGMHLVVQGTTKSAEDRLSRAARRAGVEFHTVKMYSQNPDRVQGLVLGFAAFDQRSTRKAIRDWSRQFEAAH
ncbi:MAG: PLP-dependent aminotransferase family protein [Pirellulales bacterium]|nr:PLP-dependent aminotransferase family protein [Pirellulales bacterium]